MKALVVGVLVGGLVALLWRRTRIGATLGPTRSGTSAVEASEPVPTSKEQSDDLERLLRPELYRRAQAAGIAGRSEMTKAQLIAALRARASSGGDE